jgi:hypothetical protein
VANPPTFEELAKLIAQHDVDRLPGVADLTDRAQS